MPTAVDEPVIQAPTRQIAGVYHRRIGDIIVTALSDGYLDGTVDVLQNITADDAMRMLEQNFPSWTANLGQLLRDIPACRPWSQRSRRPKP
jgi:hypothetical protein